MGDEDKNMHVKRSLNESPLKRSYAKYFKAEASSNIYYIVSWDINGYITPTAIENQEGPSISLEQATAVCVCDNNGLGHSIRKFIDDFDEELPYKIKRLTASNIDAEDTEKTIKETFKIILYDDPEAISAYIQPFKIINKAQIDDMSLFDAKEILIDSIECDTTYWNAIYDWDNKLVPSEYHKYVTVLNNK